MNSVVLTGAPEAAYIQKLCENAFTPLLKRSAKRCGFGGRIVLSEPAKSLVKEILRTQTAWSGMYDAVEEIILIAMADSQADGIADVVVGSECGRFQRADITR